MKVRKAISISFIVIFLYLNVDADDNHGHFDSFIVCCYDEPGYKAYIVQFHLKAGEEFLILPDTTTVYSIYFLSETGDTLRKGENINALYSMGYNMGIINVATCPNSEYHICRRVEGKEYWFYLTIPIPKEENVSFIVFNLTVKVKINEVVSRKTFHTMLSLSVK
ncbi:MAG: hypothetical protein H0Z29_07940 [Candidatus Marinimicrobia bacterium]|nr:hypothetical protein [Candidatus Neomarinimicrobiota bacterium]